MLMQKQKGFTLIELMIVVAIIAILAAVAVPAYTDYMKRSKVAEAVSLMAGLKTPIEEYIADGKWPSSITVLGKTQGKYTSIIKLIPCPDFSVDDFVCGFVALMKNIPNTTTPGELGMAYNPKRAVWDCTNDWPPLTNPLADKYVPSNCRGAPSL